MDLESERSNLYGTQLCQVCLAPYLLTYEFAFRFGNPTIDPVLMTRKEAAMENA